MKNQYWTDNFKIFCSSSGLVCRKFYTFAGEFSLRFWDYISKFLLGKCIQLTMEMLDWIKKLLIQLHFLWLCALIHKNCSTGSCKIVSFPLKYICRNWSCHSYGIFHVPFSWLILILNVINAYFCYFIEWIVTIIVYPVTNEDDWGNIMMVVADVWTAVTSEMLENVQNVCS